MLLPLLDLMKVLCIRCLRCVVLAELQAWPGEAQQPASKRTVRLVACG
jgi:hypothetical protein